MEADGIDRVLIAVPTTTPFELNMRVAHDDGSRDRLSPAARPQETCVVTVLEAERILVVVPTPTAFGVLTIGVALRLTVGTVVLRIPVADAPTTLPNKSIVKVTPDIGFTERRRPGASVGTLIMGTLALMDPSVRVAPIVGTNGRLLPDTESVGRLTDNCVVVGTVTGIPIVSPPLRLLGEIAGMEAVAVPMIKPF